MPLYDRYLVEQKTPEAKLPEQRQALYYPLYRDMAGQVKEMARKLEESQRWLSQVTSRLTLTLAERMQVEIMDLREKNPALTEHQAYLQAAEALREEIAYSFAALNPLAEINADLEEMKGMLADTLFQAEDVLVQLTEEQADRLEEEAAAFEEGGAGAGQSGKSRSRHGAGRGQKKPKAKEPGNQPEE